MGKYDSIINLPHKQSSKRSHMSVHDRAAQFAPFSALTGYGEEIAETARLTNRLIELTDAQLEVLNERFAFLQHNLEKNLPVKITIFVPDSAKDGGFYQDIHGIVRKINTVERTIEMENGDILFLDDIYAIEFCSTQNPL